MNFTRTGQGVFVSDDGLWRIEMAPVPGKHGDGWWLIHVQPDGDEPIDHFETYAAAQVAADELAADSSFTIAETDCKVLTLRRAGRPVASVEVRDGAILARDPITLAPNVADAYATVLQRAAVIANEQRKAA